MQGRGAGHVRQNDSCGDAVPERGETGAKAETKGHSQCLWGLPPETSKGPCVVTEAGMGNSRGVAVSSGEMAEKECDLARRLGILTPAPDPVAQNSSSTRWHILKKCQHWAIGKAEISFKFRTGNGLSLSAPPAAVQGTV